MTIDQSSGVRKDDSIDYDEVDRLIGDIVNTSDKFDRVKRDLYSSFLKKIIKTLQRVDKESLKNAKEKAYSELRKLMFRIKHAWNRLNTKENREKAKDVAEAIAEYFDDYDYILYNTTLQKATTPINTVVESQQPTTESSRAQQGATTQINTQEGKFNSFIQEILEIISDLPSEFKEKISETLNRLFETSEQQVVEVQSTTEGQQFTKVPRITIGQQTTEMQQITEGQRVTEIPQVTQGQQVTVEVQQITERQQVTEKQQVTRRYQVTEMPYTAKRQQITEEQQITTEVPQTTEGQQVTEDYSNSSLYLAAEQGNLKAVKYFVEKGIDINSKNERGKTPLHLAAEKSNLDIIKYLTEKGADINANDISMYSTLHIAVFKNKLDVVKYLVEKGAYVNVEGGYHKTSPLYDAAIIGSLDIAKCLIANGADLRRGGTATLFLAVKKGDLDFVKYLVEKNVGINTWMGRKTLLQTAIEEEKFDIAIFLVESGADIGVGYTILRQAAKKGSLDLVKHLVEKKGIDINIESQYDKTSLHLAVESSNLDLVKYLVEKGAHINVNHWIGTPLHIAVSKGNLEVVKYLISAGANVNYQLLQHRIKVRFYGNLLQR